MTIDPTSLRLVSPIDGATDVAVETDHTYSDPPLAFELYRPRGGAAPHAAVVLVGGLPDPGVVQFFGKPAKDWASNQDWARAIAASGLIAITHLNRTPADAHALIAHLRAHAGELGIDPARIGVWGCSGGGANALAVFAREHLACAALLYPFLLDLEGATEVADAAKKFYFAVPGLAIDEVPRDRPLLIARAGADATPGLEASLRAFLAAAVARGLPVTLIDHPDAPHAFDLTADSPRTREVVAEVLAFLKRSLAG